MKRKKKNDKSLKQARLALVKWFIEQLTDNTKLSSCQIRSCFYDFIGMC